MSDLKRFNKLVDDIWEMVFGTPRRPKKDKCCGGGCEPKKENSVSTFNKIINKLRSVFT